MEEQDQPNKEAQERQPAPSGITQPPVQLPAVPQQADPPAADQEPKDGSDPTKPLFIQVVGGDELEPFEEQSLAISRRTYWVAIFAFGAALAAAIFVGSQ